uniref:hypothetical protein n=1 Tax=Ferrovum sp. TaxID=2609467 RepID=UPI0026353AEE
MGRRKGGSGGALGISALVFLGLVVLGLLASIPKEVWIGISLIAALWFVTYAVNKFGKGSTASSARTSIGTASTTTVDDDVQVYAPQPI